LPSGFGVNVQHLHKQNIKRYI